MLEETWGSKCVVLGYRGLSAEGDITCESLGSKT